jgi:Cys-tRNA(Pro) deacylase
MQAYNSKVIQFAAMTENRISQLLYEHNIPHRVFRHSENVTSLEQAARERNQHPEQVIRSIVFRLGEGKFAMALMAGARQISWQALRAHFGQSRLTMASEAEVLAVTGYRVGTVSPLGLATPLPILIDESVLQHEEISLGSGERNVALMLKRDDLLTILGDVTIGKFGAEN